MKKVFFLFLMLFVKAAHGQIITGHVYRDNSKVVIASASVYYNGTMYGTITDEQGKFELAAKQQPVPIIVSCVGYYSSKVTYRPGQELIVYLKPKPEPLQAVTIRPNGMDRSEEMAIFLREFIGISANALSCTVTNPDDIYLFYDKQTKTLTASCDNPIIIKNKRLGYTISYYLDDCKIRPKLSVMFVGNYIFKESTNPADRFWAKVQRNREDAYAGSRMQFIRALWNRNMKNTDFKIYDRYFEGLPVDSILVRDSLGQKYVHLKYHIFIVNTTDHRKNNPLIQREKLTFIDKDGYYGAGLIWGGLLGQQRIGDLLPFDYQPEKELKNAM